MKTRGWLVAVVVGTLGALGCGGAEPSSEALGKNAGDAARALTCDQVLSTDALRETSGVASVRAEPDTNDGDPEYIICKWTTDAAAQIFNVMVILQSADAYESVRDALMEEGEEETNEVGQRSWITGSGMHYTLHFLSSNGEHAVTVDLWEKNWTDDSSADADLPLAIAQLVADNLSAE